MFGHISAYIVVRGKGDKSVVCNEKLCEATQTNFENGGMSTQDWLTVNTSQIAKAMD